MYERFYGFKERPFSLLPDPDFLFLGNKHQAALDLLELTILNQAGFCVVSGEIGAGKTTLIRELLTRLDDDIRVGLISNTHPSFGELLQWITAAFGLNSDSSDKFELHKRFLDFVIKQYTDNKRTLLIIDEAQNLSVSAMEELRMLSNINSDKDLVLQVILVGQSQLREKLQLPELKQFAQRIAVDYHLAGLDERETYDYIRYRLTRAGGSADVFSEDACRTVYRCTDGIPRLINGLCDNCLVYGYSAKSPVILPELVREVVRDQRTGQLRTSTDDERRDEAGKSAPEASDAESPVLAGARPATQPEVEPIADEKAEAPTGESADSQKQSVAAENAPEAASELATPQRSNPPSSDAAPETIVGAMEAALLQEGGHARTPEARQRRSAEIERLTALDAEGETALGGSFSGAQADLVKISRQGNVATARVALGLALVIGVGAAGGLAWLLGGEKPLNATVVLPLAGTAGPPATGMDVQNTRPVEVVVGGQPTRQGGEPAAEQNLEGEQREAERRQAEQRLAAQLEAEQQARERREAEERLAAQLEAERLVRLRQEAEARLTTQREAERLQRLRREAEEERLAAQREAERLQRERREAEARRVAQREAKRKAALAKWKKANSGIGWSDVPEDATTSAKATPSGSAQSGSPERGPSAGANQSPAAPSSSKARASALSDAELRAKRAAALAAWRKANGGIGWAEEVEDDDGEID